MLGWILLLVLLFTGFVGFAVLYLLYRRTPERIWRQMVFALGEDVYERLRGERETLESLPERRRADEDELNAKAYLRLLAGSAVEELLPYPGIGDATVAKLRQHG